MGHKSHPTQMCGHCGKSIQRKTNNRMKCIICHTKGCSRCMKYFERHGGFVHENCKRIKQASIVCHEFSTLPDNRFVVILAVAYNAEVFSIETSGDTEQNALAECLSQAANHFGIEFETLDKALLFHDKSHELLRKFRVGNHTCGI